MKHSFNLVIMGRYFWMEKQTQRSKLTYFRKGGTKESVQARKNNGKMKITSKMLYQYEDYCNQLGKKKKHAYTNHQNI